MQITETGVTTVTNVENNETSSSCKGVNVLQDHTPKLDNPMAEPSPSSSRASNGSNVISTEQSNSAILQSESSQLHPDVLQGDIKKPNFDNLSEVDPSGNCTDMNGAVVGILGQADTTSVENLSIVTVVEKELETNQGIPNNDILEENINDHGKLLFI